MATSRKLPGELKPLSRERLFNRILGSGATFPFSFSSIGDVKSVSVSSGLAKVNQSIHNILSTRKGERVYRPTFGCFTGDTQILLTSGLKVPICQLVGKRVETFGTEKSEKSSHSPAAVGLHKISIKAGAVSQGKKKIVELTLSNGEMLRCTPDHLFLLADYQTYLPASELAGVSLGWVNIREPHFRGRILASKRVRNSYLGDLPFGNFELTVLNVEPLEEEEEVFDLVDSPTSNFTLGCGAIVHNSNLHKLIFEPNDTVLFAQLKFEVADALRTWEKRIKILKIAPIGYNFKDNIELLKSIGYNTESLVFIDDPNTIGIYIEYEVLKSHQVGSYVYPFKREATPVGYALNVRGPYGST